MSRWRRGLRPAMAFAVVAAGAAAGYVVGTQNPQVHVDSGTAYVGDHQATAFTAGWAYAIPMEGPWFDAAGTWHDGGPPACLTTVGSTVSIRFGWTSVAEPQGASWRQVDWVSCP